MKHIKLFENFDTEELKSELEIPYLTGDLDNIIKKSLFKFTNKDLKDFYYKINDKYSELDDFYKKIEIIDNDEYLIYNQTSEKYYCFIGFYYEDEHYHAFSINRKLEDYDDRTLWFEKSTSTKDINKIYTFIENFLKECKRIKVI